MKKIIILALAVLLTAGVASMALANGLGMGIAGSPHDFSTDVWNARQEICRVCHVPHDHQLATQYYLNGLLWNHGVSSATYTMYNNAWSSSINGVSSAQPDGTAKLCLGCHDGTVAIDTFDKYAGGTIFIGGYNAGYKIPGFLDGTNLDLRGTHPISITYNDDPAAGGDVNLAVATATAIGTSGTIAEVLDNGKVQCSSCHDVHDQEAVAGTHLLRVAQTVATGGSASGLCLTCHIK
ncbi:MAG: hypothetical protein HY808_15650 [Nitrospirae bacterium]|nr:hypothetical protein [Nitrospirota bacterium]